ncbi:hypothetical protein D3C84_951720 [compost metagenome]
MAYNPSSPRDREIADIQLIVPQLNAGQELSELNDVLIFFGVNDRVPPIEGLMARSLLAILRLTTFIPPF